MAVEKCKGTRDLSPREMERFRLVEGIFRDCCLKWGYEEVRTPTIEYLYLFTAAGTLTPARLGKVYSFLDWDGWSGERVVLRPDGTIPMARYYIEAMAGKAPARLFYVANVFSFEETGVEKRERWQGGVELIGEGAPAADVELVMMALKALRRLGLKNIQLRLSHAGLIRALLASHFGEDGLSVEEQSQLFDRVLDGDVHALTDARPELAGAITPLFELKGKSSGFLKNMAAMFGMTLPAMKSSLDNLTEIAGMLDDVGVKYEIDIAAGRGFEYYTGLVFHLSIDGELVAGGGRYDALVPLLGGTETPASGFALYFDKLMNLIDPASLSRKPARSVMVHAASGGPGLRDAYGLADALQDAGFAAHVLTAGEDSGDVGWRVDVKESGPRFVAREAGKRRRFEAETAKELVEMIGVDG